MEDRKPAHGGYKPEWKVVKKLVDGELAVFVSQDVKSFRPRYSAQLGKLRQDGTLAPFVPFSTEGTFNITLKPGLKPFAALVEQADQWVLEEIALRTDSDIDKRIEREMKGVNRDKANVRHTGKTAKKKARLAAAKAHTQT